MAKMAWQIGAIVHRNERDSYAGPEVDERFDTLPDTGDDNDYATAVEKLNGYFSPRTNIAYEVYNFRQTKQKTANHLIVSPLDRSHAIVTTQTSDPVHRGNAEIVVDMHLTGINVQPKEKPATHVEKLVILLMLADQNPKLWLV